ncbi:DUF4157 domain-containing protein [Undibacterium sp. BYS107W]|uniref:DUF4157 domain-containing protein n=2 Tax=Undibacterium baiyunense TaxID=2828731 RepID=A0A941I4R6_9BURK|nr:DUF4157 domain-containing protein [Undibacterium baiyunense]
MAIQAKFVQSTKLSSDLENLDSNADLANHRQSSISDASQNQVIKTQDAVASENIESDRISPRPDSSRGLPKYLKMGIESLSGISMDHVQVHYNSDRPAQLNAYAYAQGSQIHLAHGQEHHLPHEAWHVVQQAQGRVKPTMQMKTGALINDDSGLEAEADKMGMQASNLLGIKNTMQLHSSLPNFSAMPMQLSYKFEKREWGEGNRKMAPKSFEEEGSDGKFTRVEADSELPTAYGVLSSIFGKNLRKEVFKKTSMLASNCTRPHLVSASLERNVNRDVRGSDDAAIVTAIGNLGDEEFLIRNGPSKLRTVSYHGGHFIGNQVMGGDISNVPWNVAPQDANNNQFAYNFTIEKMLRDAVPGTQYSYEVKVSYRSLNYRVNQQTLLDNKIIKELDPKLAWEIQIPARIPQIWEATATMTNDGQFASPAKTEGTTYDQLSQDLEGELNERNKRHSAHYKLDFEDEDKNELALEDVKYDASAVKKISFEMHQVQPSDLESSPPPKNWGENVMTDFGEVMLEKVTVEKVEKLLKEIRDQYEKIDFTQMEDDIDIKDEEFSRTLNTFQFGSETNLDFQIQCADKIIGEFEKFNYFLQHKNYCQKFNTELDELNQLNEKLQKEGAVVEKIGIEDIKLLDQNELRQRKRTLEAVNSSIQTLLDKKANIRMKRDVIMENKTGFEDFCNKIKKERVVRKRYSNIRSFVGKRGQLEKSDLMSIESRILEIKPSGIVFK